MISRKYDFIFSLKESSRLPFLYALLNSGYQVCSILCNANLNFALATGSTGNNGG